MEKMESEKEITHFDAFMCVFLERWHFLNGTNIKSHHWRPSSKEGWHCMVLSSRAVSLVKKLNIAKMKWILTNLSKLPLGFNKCKRVAVYRRWYWQQKTAWAKSDDSSNALAAMGNGKQQCWQQQQLQGGPQQSPQQQVTVMAVATADALTAVEVTVAAMMGNSGRDRDHD